ncbi:MAG: type II secretion system secretin GspD, partial [Myxococcaceae bacterium]
MPRSSLLRLSPLVLALVAAPSFAQRRPPPPGGAGGDRQIAPSVPAQPAAQNPGAPGAVPDAPRANRTTPNCEEVRRKAKFNIYFDKVDIEKLVQTVADATCRTFILPENIRGKISIVGPENGRVEVDADAFYAAFLAALDSNGLTVYAHGRFMKIVDKQRAKNSTIPTFTDPDEPYTTNEQMITKMFKVKYVDIEPLRGVVQQLVSPSGDTIPFQPDTIIINDVGSNMHRLEKIITQLDTRPLSDEVRVMQLQFASAQEIAEKVTKLFEARGNKPGQRPGTIAPPAPGSPGTGAPPGVPATSGESTGSSGGPATLTQLIPDERTNKLIVVASPAAFDRINALVKEIDVPISGSERINVYYLENAAAEDLASTLQSLSQGTQNRPRQGNAPAIPGAPPQSRAAGAPVQAAELFSGEVKISADKATNSLVVIASSSDYRNLVKVIEKLDRPRRQVFIEAVIMEVNLNRNSQFGIEAHGGFLLNAAGGQLPVVLGTNYKGSGPPPSTTLTSLASLGGFLAGLQGPLLATKDLIGFDIPQFGVVLNALQSSSDVNVLSTPHILTTDNEEAEITVGQNIPFQAGFSPSNLGGLGGLAGAAGQTGALAGLGGLGSFFAPINRQNVELKLNVKPQINEADHIRLVINESTEEIASQDPVLGPTTSKRSAKTTVVAKDQQTVVLGGIMQDRVIEGVKKIPILGDIPLLGHIFRSETRGKVKTNLLLFLTPYIIKDQSDFQRIFDRKMKERQQFIEQFYGQVSGYDVAIDFSRKSGPLAKMGQALTRERNKLENGGMGQPGEKVYRPGETPPEQTPNNATVPPIPGQPA